MIVSMRKISKANGTLTGDKTVGDQAENEVSLLHCDRQISFIMQNMRHIIDLDKDDGVGDAEMSGFSIGLVILMIELRIYVLY